jgi:hypothetical protein
MTSLRASLGWVVGLLALAPSAWAQEEPAPLAVKLGVDVNQVVTAELNVTSSFTEQFRKKLGGGLTSRVLIEVVLQDANGNDLSVRVRSCQLRLDVWDDLYYVGVRDGSRQRRGTFASVDEALAACGAVSDFQLVDLELLGSGASYRLLGASRSTPCRASSSSGPGSSCPTLAAEPAARGPGPSSARWRGSFVPTRRPSGETFAFKPVAWRAP